MNSFQINIDVKVDIKVRTELPDNHTWYMINLEHMMLNMGSENMNATGQHDRIYMGQTYALREIKGKLHYFDQVGNTWFLLEDRVQKEYSDYVADKELLGE